MGSPQTPDARQYAALEKAGQLETLGRPERVRVEAGQLRLTFALPRQGVSLVKVQY
jgi:xylan 1,4-beta-xylosidase